MKRKGGMNLGVMSLNRLSFKKKKNCFLVVFVTASSQEIICIFRGVLPAVAVSC